MVDAQRVQGLMVAVDIQNQRNSNTSKVVDFRFLPSGFGSQKPDFRGIIHVLGIQTSEYKFGVDLKGTKKKSQRNVEHRSARLPTYIGFRV